MRNVKTNLLISVLTMTNPIRYSSSRAGNG